MLNIQKHFRIQLIKDLIIKEIKTHIVRMGNSI